jgi:hypothetical protein
MIQTYEEDSQEQDLPWQDLAEDPPTAPQLPPQSHAKIFKLAKEVKRQAALMTTWRDLHDIRTILHLLACWNFLQPLIRSYFAHHLRFLYVAIELAGSLVLLPAGGRQVSGLCSSHHRDPEWPSRGRPKVCGK